jgi:hypothetical protein
MMAGSGTAPSSLPLYGEASRRRVMYMPIITENTCPRMPIARRPFIIVLLPGYRINILCSAHSIMEYALITGAFNRMEYALITGASKGIGKAITTDLAARGFNRLARSPLRRIIAAGGQSHHRVFTPSKPIGWPSICLPQKPRRMSMTGAAQRIHCPGPRQQCRLRPQWPFRKIFDSGSAPEHDAP